MATSFAGGGATGAGRPDYARFGLFYLGYYGYVGLISPYVSLYFADRGFNPVQIGVLMASFQVSRIVGPYLWGWLSDVMHTRVRILRVSAFTSLLAFLMLPGVGSYGGMMAMMLTLSLLTSAMSPLGDALTISTLRRYGAFDHSYGRIRMFGSVGFIGAVLAAGRCSKRSACAPSRPASTLLAILAGVVLTMRDAPPTARTRRRRAPCRCCAARTWPGFWRQPS